MVNIQKDSKELRDGDGWMGVVQLNCNLLWKKIPIKSEISLKITKDILNGSGDEKVLLLQT